MSYLQLHSRDIFCINFTDSVVKVNAFSPQRYEYPIIARKAKIRAKFKV